MSKFSLNEDDYTSPDDYNWDLMLVEIISQSLTDLLKAPTNHPDYKTAHNFIFGEYLDMWCIAFGRNLDTKAIRNNAKRIISDPEYRAYFRRHLHDKTMGRYTYGDKEIV